MTDKEIFDYVACNVGNLMDVIENAGVSRDSFSTWLEDLNEAGSPAL